MIETRYSCRARSVIFAPTSATASRATLATTLDPAAEAASGLTEAMIKGVYTQPSWA